MTRSVVTGVMTNQAGPDLAREGYVCRERGGGKAQRDRGVMAMGIKHETRTPTVLPVVTVTLAFYVRMYAFPASLYGPHGRDDEKVSASSLFPEGGGSLCAVGVHVKFDPNRSGCGQSALPQPSEP
uniref:Uncharacterized protein n=1 Tax=Panagrellus redivivus TaxID=6233 RepID=A0A7E4WB89_PANRE